MNYEPNLTHWVIGDVVIHDADAKQREMLMQVIGFSRKGLVKTRYLSSKIARSTSKVWENEMKYLHDPKRFGIEARVHL